MLTIGLPVYNASATLRETLDSLFAQSYGDFELLAIDDGSKDDSAAILASYTDPRLRIIRQDNRGLPATLNRMLEEARNPWLVRHDADDIAYPQRLEKIAATITQHPQAGMVYSLADYYQNGLRFGSFRTTKNGPAALRALTRAGYLLSICHPSVALNIAVVRALGGYRALAHVEDIDLWARITRNHDAVLIPEKLLGMRIHAGSVSSLHLEEQALRTLYVQYLLLSDLWGLEAQTFEAVRPALSPLLNRAQLRSKSHIRAINMNLARRDYARAACAAGQALLADPRFFIQRALLEWREQDKPVVNGLDPLLYAARAPLLWPQIKGQPTHG